MVGRHTSSVGVSRRSQSFSGSSLGRRPKRRAPIKAYDDTVGLSRKEERELKKALYASLQDSRRLSKAFDIHVPTPVPVAHPTRQSVKHSSSAVSSAPVAAPVTPVRTVTSRLTRSLTEERNQEAAKSADLKKAKVRAQRKFAEGSLPCTPNTTPVKINEKVSPVKLFTRTAKTEDFLTFLCIRGSPLLPRHLNFFNFSRRGQTQALNDSQTTEASHVVGKDPGVTRESTPESSSISSNMNDEVYDTRTPSPVNHVPVTRTGTSASRKAARASASTPETARGIVSLRQGFCTPHRGKLMYADKTPSPGQRGRFSRGHISRRVSAMKSLSPHFSKISQRKRLQQKSALNRMKNNSHHSRRNEDTNNVPVTRGKLKNKSLELLDPTVKLIERRKKSAADRKSDYERKPSELDRKETSTQINGKKDSNQSKVATKRSLSDQKSKTVAEKNKRQNIIRKSKLYHGKKAFQNSKLKRLASNKRTLPLRRSSARIQELTTAIKARQRRQPPCYIMSDSEEGEPFDDEDRKDETFVVPGNVIETTKMTMLTRSRQEKSSPSIEDSLCADNVAVRQRMDMVKKVDKVSTQRDQLKLSKMIERRRKLRKDSSGSSTNESPTKRARKSSVEKPADSSRKSSQLEPFPKPEQPSRIVDVPVFHPTEEDLSNVVSYIESLRSEAAPYGMCKVIPPPAWKVESKVNEEIRFTAQVQFIHKLFKRWGPSVQHTACIRRHLQTIGAALEPSPQIGGVEVDLSKLSQTIQEFGGMQNMVDKKKWNKVADAMKIPKLAQDRCTKLYDIYCKHLLPYDTLSLEEKHRLEQSVIADHQRKEKTKMDDEEGIVKGKSNSLSVFIRVARNVQSMWYKDEPTPEQVEFDYWRVVEERTNHVAVQCGHVNINTQVPSSPAKKDNSSARHAWSLADLFHHPDNCLNCLGPVSGVTIPTMHIGMTFSTSCWCSDTHNLPYIQYLHTGASTIWYSIPKQEERNFKRAMTDLVPSLVSDQPRWLKEDITMVNPKLLAMRGVSVGRCVQKPREFLVVFPHSYTATICCGYNVSESAHYATRQWISNGLHVAESLNKSKEAELFAFEALLFHLAQDANTDKETLKVLLSPLKKTIDKEISQRKQLSEAGLRTWRRLTMPEDTSPQSRKKSMEPVEEKSCEMCKKICFLSMVMNEADHTVYCLDHGLPHIQKKRNLKNCKLSYRFSEEEMKTVLDGVQTRQEGCTTESAAKKRLKKQDGRS
ncbi:protein Jumonji-like [Gigantopelta aegis]|uniref:protein Jumonji-like n=1 Tax=Gigantopelta aegis TaxID=1735272 RepID=UPI001B8886AB|nr:protein Jumonji-like [Gigantopelta aegis]